MYGFSESFAITDGGYEEDVEDGEITDVDELEEAFYGPTIPRTKVDLK